MFSTHQPKISEYALENAENFGRTVAMVIITIQESLHKVPQLLKDVETGAENTPSILYGWKRQGYEFAKANASELYKNCTEIVAKGLPKRETEKALITEFCRVVGLGLAKAGFCCQLIFGVSGCLDTHNVVRMGLNPNHLKSTGFKKAKSEATRQKWLDRYCDMVDAAGGTEKLWDDWCTHVFHNSKTRKNYTSAMHVSSVHLDCLGLAA